MPNIGLWQCKNRDINHSITDGSQNKSIRVHMLAAIAAISGNMSWTVQCQTMRADLGTEF